MKKNATRLLAMLLALLMMLSLVACSKAPASTDAPATETSKEPSAESSTEEPAKPESESEGAEEPAEADPFGKYEEPITINVVRTLDSTIGFNEDYPETYSLEDNVWSHAYEDYLNIKLNYLWTPIADEYATKWNMAMATNSLPDMGWVDGLTYQKLVEADLVEDMTDIFEEYASDYYKAQVEADGGVTREFMTFNGRMLGLPLTGTTPDGINLLFVRRDWLDAVGMDAPTTIDELVEVAQAFKDAKLGGDDTYGICMSPYAFAGECDWEGFLNGYGAYYNIWVEDGNGGLAYSTTQPEMREAVLKLQEMYAAGLITTDMAVNPNAREDLVAGKVGMAYGTYWAPISAIQSNMNNDPNADWIVCELPTVDGSPMTTQAWGDGVPSKFFFVRKGCEHPEAAVKMVNLHYKLDVEQPTVYNFHEGSMIQVHQYRLTEQWEPWRNMQACYRIWEAMETGDESLLQTANDKDMYATVTGYLDGTCPREKVGYALVNAPEDSTYSICDELNKDGRIILSAYTTITPAHISEKLLILDGKVTDAILKVICGEDISVFDEAIEYWHNNGGDDITQEVNEWYANK